MTYPLMADDIVRLADSLNIDKFTILGHSMGGKVAMTTACKHPDRVDGWISVDAAPYDYNNNTKYIAFVQEVVDFVKDFQAEGKSKQEIKTILSENFDNPAIAHLLMTNMEFNEKDLVSKWKSNMDTLANSSNNVFGWEYCGEYKGPFLALVAGKKRSFHLVDFEKSFPNATEEDIVAIDGAGHFVHVDRPSETINQIGKFLERVDGDIY